jgi:rSAM/selenodomain-associated transferase 1
MTVRLAVFARVPVRGKVKSRLAAALGVEGALRAHIELVEDTLARLGRVPGTRTELWVDTEPDERVRAWSARWAIPLYRQRGPDLGTRMYGALVTALAAGAPGLVVGVDCPSVDSAYVIRAVQALRYHDVVLGPAEDGGFGLIGLAVPAPGLFAGVPWGGPEVLAATLTNASAGDLSVALLPAIWDVDEPADWLRWRRSRVGAFGVAAPEMDSLSAVRRPFPESD